MIKQIKNSQKTSEFQHHHQIWILFWFCLNKRKKKVPKKSSRNKLQTRKIRNGLGLGTKKFNSWKWNEKNSQGEIKFLIAFHSP